jgi:hypothetical protein
MANAPLRPFDIHKAKALFLMADIKVSHMFEMINQYWPRDPRYYTDLVESPWYAATTEYGIIILGWRKRVIEIDWTHCEVRGPVTDDNVTKYDHLVHAYSEEDAIKYLKNFRALADTLNKFKK